MLRLGLNLSLAESMEGVSVAPQASCCALRRGALLGVAIWHAQLGKHVTKVERNACGVSFLQIFSDLSFAIIIHII